MEKIKITYLEALDILNGGISLFSLNYELLNEKTITDIFFLEEDLEKEFLIIGEDI